MRGGYKHTLVELLPQLQLAFDQPDLRHALFGKACIEDCTNIGEIITNPVLCNRLYLHDNFHSIRCCDSLDLLAASLRAR